MSKSLFSRSSRLASQQEQLKVLSSYSERIQKLPRFLDKVFSTGSKDFKSGPIEIFQVNVGKLCNQVCKHCHVDAGPDRREVMSRETMEKILKVLSRSRISTVDITGGAPEMNPHFRWLIEELSQLNKKIMVRCNLTILKAHPKYADLPEFYKRHNVQVISSLPHYSKSSTDRQRGQGVFNKSLEALKELNNVGYGKPESGLILDLVYNPAGAFLPASQKSLEQDFKRELKRHFGIEFNNLYTITNLPVSRYLEYLIESGNYEDYMEKLVNSFNPAAAQAVMCKNTISVDWQGELYDCDFNQMLDIKVSCKHHSDLDHWDEQVLSQRSIVTHQHCYGCTAGAGSSCGGAVVE